MSANESSRINPYAPSTLELDRVGEPSGSFPQSGIGFSGAIDLPSVRNTRGGSLAVGLILSLSFIGLLMSAAVALASGGAFVVLGFASGLTAIALWAFVQGQTDRPLLRFDWMQGATDGMLHQHRLDIRWNDGESAGSFVFPKSTTDVEFSNRHGRLLVIRAVPCFIPRQAMSPELWEQVSAFRPQPAPSESASLLERPAASSEGSAVIWPPADDRFLADRQKHEFVCREPKFARMIFIVSLIFLVLIGVLQREPGNAAAAKFVLWMAATFSGLFWLVAEWRRRDWGAASMPRLRLPEPTEPPPAYQRWLDAHRVLVGYHDAWICVPWSAVQKATITPYAIEFSLTPLCLDNWFLERGAFTDQQWLAIIQHVRSQTTQVALWGAVRRTMQQGVGDV